MTTITAKRCRPTVRPRLAPLAAAVLALTGTPARAGWDVAPGLQLREIYTDNVNLQADALAQSQLISEITPTLSLQHSGPRLTVSSLLSLHTYTFADSSISGTKRTQREANATAQAKLIDDFLYVDAHGMTGERPVSLFGQQGSDNGYASANRGQITTYGISPYIVHHFGANANLELRYTHDSVDTATTGIGSSKGDSVLFNLASGRAFRTVGWTVQYLDQKIADKVAQATRSQTVNTGLRYYVRPTLALTAGVGYDKFDYASLGGVTQGRSWNTGFAWNPSARTSLAASVGRRYVGAVKTLSAMHRSRLTVWNISYDNSITTMRSNFMLPATLDTASMLDRLFIPDFPDPLARQRAVADYLRLTGLPGELTDSVNYFTNRYYLQKQLRASAAFNAPHTTTLLSVYRIRRDALSVRQSDSQLLGTALSSINDNTDQTGVDLALSYRLSMRSALTLAGEGSNSQSLSTGLKTTHRALRLAYTRALSRTIDSSVEVHRVSGNIAAAGARSYRENAISASLSFKL